MALTRLNNRSISAVTALPSGITSLPFNLLSSDMPAGSVVQAVTAINTNNGALSVAASAQIPDLVVNITPKFVNSKFFIMARVGGELNTDAHATNYRIRRNSTDINIGTGGNSYYNNTQFVNTSEYHGGDDQDSTPHTATLFTVDSPNTLATIAYSVWISTQSGETVTYYYGRTVNSSGANAYERQSRELIVMEIKQ